MLTESALAVTLKVVTVLVLVSDVLVMDGLGLLGVRVGVDRLHLRHALHLAPGIARQHAGVQV
eukprot:3940923-Rhodomonas_salina.1